MQKKILFCFFILFVLNQDVTGQALKNKLLLGGSFSIKEPSFFNPESTTRTNLDINLGYKLKRLFVIGLRSEYNLEKNRPASYEKNSKTIRGSIFARQYVRIWERFQPFLDVSLGYSYRHIKSYSGTYDSHRYFTHYGLGFNFFLTDWLALETLYKVRAIDIDKNGPFDFYDADARIGVQLFW